MSRETGRREQSPKSHCSFYHLSSDAFELGRNLYCKALSSQSYSILKNVQILCYPDVWFCSLPQLHEVGDSTLLDALDMPCADKCDLYWLQYDIHGRQS